MADPSDALGETLAAIVPAASATLQLPLAGLGADDADRVAMYVERASAEATLRAYRSDWRIFEEWCAGRGHAALPGAPATVAAFLADLAERGQARSTIARRLAAIVYAHRMARVTPPTLQPDAPLIELTLRGIRRHKRGDDSAAKRAADGDVLRDMLRSIEGDALRAHRDRALLALGMAGAFRRSELVAIAVSHVREVARGLEILVPHAKADQEGRGATVAIPDAPRIAPVRLYRAWLAASGIVSGPLFRKLTPQGRLTLKPMSDRGVAIIVKACAAAAGYDPSGFAGHSLRAGFLTEAGRQGANPFKMKEHSRHASLETVASYVRDEERFRDHAGDGFL